MFSKLHNRNIDVEELRSSSSKYNESLCGSNGWDLFFIRMAGKRIGLLSQQSLWYAAVRLDSTRKFLNAYLICSVEYVCDSFWSNSRMQSPFPDLREVNHRPDLPSLRFGRPDLHLLGLQLDLSQARNHNLWVARFLLFRSNPSYLADQQLPSYEVQIKALHSSVCCLSPWSEK